MEVNEREIVLDMLIAVDKGDYSHIVLGDTLEKYAYLDKQVRSFITRCFEGTLEYRYRIDWELDHFSNTPVRKMKPLIRNLLRMSVYQIIFMDQTPAHAVCNEAVKLAGKRGFNGLKGFVNGVLRNVARECEDLPHPDKEKDAVEYLAWKYSMPMWLVRMWQDRFGAAVTEELLSELLCERPLTIRVNRMKTDAARLRESLVMDGVKLRECKYYSDSFYLEEFDSLMKLKAYGEGLFTVQDAASMLAVLATGAKPGDKVIDVCAAPGGKSMLLAELVGESGSVIARDVSESKVEWLSENVARMGYDRIFPEVFDATRADESKNDSMDVVFADLPCSGLGIIGRKSDIKYKVSEEEIHELAKLQHSILGVIRNYVKPGGVLLFSTCTISKEENEDNVKAFLSENPQFELVPLFDESIGRWCHDKETADRLLKEGSKGFYQLLPCIEETDGFFIAKFRRVR